MTAYYLFASQSSRVCLVESPRNPSGQWFAPGIPGPWKSPVTSYRQFADALSLGPAPDVLISTRARKAIERAPLLLAADIVPVELADFRGHVMGTWFAFCESPDGDDSYDLHKEGGYWRASSRFMQCIVDNNLGGFCFSRTPECYHEENVVVDTCALDTPFWDALSLSDRLDRHRQLWNVEQQRNRSFKSWAENLRQRLAKVEETWKGVCIPSTVDYLPNLKVKCEPPTTPEELTLVESKLGRRLPEWLADWYLHFSSNLSVIWSLEDQTISRLPESFTKPAQGCCVAFKLRSLPSHAINLSDCEELCLGPDDRMHWSQIAFKDMVVISKAADGAGLAAVISGPYEGAIVKLDSNPMQFECTIISDSLTEFMDTWLSLLCVDLRAECIIPFYDSGEQRWRSDTEIAEGWRQAVMKLA